MSSNKRKDTETPHTNTHTHTRLLHAPACSSAQKLKSLAARQCRRAAQMPWNVALPLAKIFEIWWCQPVLFKLLGLNAGSGGVCRKRRLSLKYLSKIKWNLNKNSVAARRIWNKFPNNFIYGEWHAREIAKLPAFEKERI